MDVFFNLRTLYKVVFWQGDWINMFIFNLEASTTYTLITINWFKTYFSKSPCRKVPEAVLPMHTDRHDAMRWSWYWYISIHFTEKNDGVKTINRAHRLTNSGRSCWNTNVFHLQTGTWSLQKWGWKWWKGIGWVVPPPRMQSWQMKV